MRVNTSDLRNFSNYDYDFFFLPDHGDSALVRLMYKDRAELDEIGEILHKVEVGGKEKWVDCLGNNCPLCARGLKQHARIILQMFVEEVVINNKKSIKERPAIWDRGASLSDLIDVAFKRAKGDVCNQLVEITRVGKKGDTNTTYNMTIIETDDTTLEDLGEPIERGKLILEKTVEELEDYLDTGSFDEESKPKRRPTSGRNIPATRGTRNEEDTETNSGRSLRRERNTQTEEPEMPRRRRPSSEDDNNEY